MKRLILGTEAYLPSGFVIATLGALTFLLFALVSPSLISGDTFTLIGCGIVFFALLCVVLASQRSRPLDSAKGYLRLALVVWWSLLVSGGAFFRQQQDAETFAGKFSAGAYGQTVFWAFAFVALLLMPKPHYLRQSFSGCSKWLSLYALVCLASVIFAPRPLYSLAWAFELFLVIVVLLLCSATIRDLKDIESFFWATFGGFVILTVVPVARVFQDPSTAFEGGRLSEAASPTGLALSAGTLLLLALILYSLRQRTWLAGFMMLGATVMIMSGGKAGIIAAIASVAVFFLLQKRIAVGFGWLLGILALGCVVFAVTPLSTYFTTYHAEDQLSTVTGRTDLWRAALPEIMEHPIVGHGYVASRFVSVQVVGAFWEAGHLHNGFMEVLYNNGLIGLVLLLAMHVAILKNAVAVLKTTRRHDSHVIAIGILVLYINILVNGLANATFGGHAYAPFMLFLALIVVSEALRKQVNQRLSPL
jgi:O-antigen ligase